MVCFIIASAAFPHTFASPKPVQVPRVPNFLSRHNSKARVLITPTPLSVGPPPPPPPSTFSSDNNDDGSLGPLNILSVWWSRYGAALEQAPLRTKAISAAVLVWLADLCAQRLSGMSNLDIARLARFALFGLLFTGPAGHFWNVALENLVQLPGVRGVLTKVAFDQVFFSPIATAIFFAVMKVAEGYNLQDTRDFLKNNLGGTIVSSWRLWPLANVVNFSCVPPSHRVVFTSAVSVVWISFMSLVANRTVAPVVVP